jgi:EmrB/QacA subfamily drug resistance transporter
MVPIPGRGDTMSNAESADSTVQTATEAAEPGPEETGPTHRQIMIVLVPLMLVAFIATLDQTIVATAIPGIGRALRDLRNGPWIATSYLLTSAVSTLILGKLGDMYGRKKVFQFAVVVFLAGSLVSGLAASMGMLIAARALQGVGGGGLSSLVQAITGDLLPARQRSKYNAYLGVVATLAVVAGPILGGVFVDDISWRWIFFLNLPIGAAALVMIAAKLHLPVRTSDRSADLTGGVVAAVFITAALLVSVWGGTRYGWGSGQILGLAAVAVAGLLAYLVVEHRAAEPITPLGLFRNSIFSICSALFFMSTLVLFVAMLYVPLLMQEVHHYSAFESGMFLIPLLVGLIAATAVSGQLISKTGRYKFWPVLGAILAGGGMYLASLIGASTPTWLLGADLAVVGAGLGLFVQVAILAGQNAVDYQVLGVATGALNFFKTIGGAFGAAVFGAILTAELPATAPTTSQFMHGFQAVFLWTVPVMAVALVLAMVMREKPLAEHMADIASGKIEVPEY